MHNSYKYITDVATYNFYGTETNRVVLHGINVNTTTGGTLTIKAGATIIGVIAAGTSKGTYWKSEKGMEIEALNMTNVAVENITVEYSNI
jgi:hypothetical protein